MVSLSALVTKGSLGGDSIPAGNKKTKKTFNLLRVKSTYRPKPKMQPLLSRKYKLELAAHERT